MMNLKREIVDFLENKEDPVKLKNLLRGLGLPPSDRQYMRSLLRELVREGFVIKRGAHFWVPDGKTRAKEIKRGKTRESKEVTGRLSVTGSGHGYVRLSNGKEWMVPESALGEALSGDIVRLRQRGRESSGREIGEVVAVESFGRTKLLGIFEWHGAKLIFRPFGGLEVPAHLLKNMPKDVKDGSVGTWLRQTDGKWLFDGIVGHITDPVVDEVIALAENDIIADFPEPVLAEVAGLDPDFEFVLGDRRDFRGEWVFTIDGADARDFDDALHLKRLSDDTLELGIHIADVATFVKEGSQLDQWAQQKGNSTYLPHKALPMLPEILSTNLCSLNPDVPRYTLSVVAILDNDGVLKSFSLHKGLIQSRNRLTYSQVAEACIEKVPEVRESLGELAETLDHCMALAGKMRQRRAEAGGLDMDMVDVRLVLDENQLIDGVRLYHQTDANRLIEAYMVLANECVARFFLEKGIDIPFRIHEKPNPEKLEQLGTFLANSGVMVPDNLMEQPGQAINEIIRIVKERPNAQVLQTQMLKALKMAVYSPNNIGHFGLASEEYAHFTSPIRRYADLVVHRRLSIVLEQPDLGPEHFDDQGLESVCDHISTTERNAMRAENTFVQLKLLRMMLKELGNTFQAVVTEVKAFGLFVELEANRAQGLVHVGELGDDYYEYNPETLSLVGKRSQHVYTVGTELEVQVVRVDLIARKLDLGLVKPAKRSRSHGSGQRGSSRRNKDPRIPAKRPGKPRPPKGRKRGRR